MKYRKLGNTGLIVSEISFGCIPILKGEVSILPHYYNLNEKEAINVFESAYQNGINLFDTAVVPEYGDAEIKLGKFAKTHNDIIISSKARAYNSQSMNLALSNSLHNLKKDNIDIYFVHQVAPENVDEVFCEGSALDTLVKHKKLGYIKNVGIATHHYDIALRAAMDRRVDVIQFPGNIFERGLLDRMESDNIFYEKGLLLCKVFAAGVLTDYFSVNSLVNFALSYPISSAILGFGTSAHVNIAVNSLKNTFVRPSIDFVKNKLESIYDIVPCDRCQKCSCSKGIEIESVFRYHNYYYLGHRNWALERLYNCGDDLLQSCVNCQDRICEKKCPNNINIQKEIINILKNKGEKIVMKNNLKPGKDYIGVGVGAVILRDGKILLLLRKKTPENGCWTIPGGKVEFGETVEEAILREVKEEIGTDGKIIAPLGVTNHILMDEHIHYVSPRFLVNIIGDPKNMEPESHSEMKWFSIDDLPENVTMTTQKALSAFLTWNDRNSSEEK